MVTPRISPLTFVSYGNHNHEDVHFWGLVRNLKTVGVV